MKRVRIWLGVFAAVVVQAALVPALFPSRRA